MLGCVSFGRNVWEFVDCFSLVIRRLRKITRQFNVPSGLCVSVLAMWAWLGRGALVCVVLLARSKLVIKSLRGMGYEPI